MCTLITVKDETIRLYICTQHVLHMLYNKWTHCTAFVRHANPFLVGWIACCCLKHLSEELIGFANTIQTPHSLFNTLIILHWLIETCSLRAVYGGHIILTLIQTPPLTCDMVIFPPLVSEELLSITFFFFNAGIKKLSSSSALAAKRSLLQIGFINLLVYGSPNGTLFIHRRRLK